MFLSDVGGGRGGGVACCVLSIFVVVRCIEAFFIDPACVIRRLACAFPRTCDYAKKVMSIRRNEVYGDTVLLVG